MYELMMIEGVGKSERLNVVDSGTDFERLSLAKESMSKALLVRGIRLDQARVALRPAFVPCAPGLCARCDHARDLVAGTQPHRENCDFCNAVAKNQKILDLYRN